MNSTGMSLVEGLMAAGMLSLGILALNTTVMDIGKGAQKSRLTSTALALESKVISAFQNPANFIGSTATQLAAGNVPSGMTLEVEGAPLAQLGTPSYYDTNGNACTAFTQTNCLLKLEVGISCETAGLPYSFCKGAYRISPAPGTPLISQLGVPGNGPFAAGDYRIPIPYDLYVKTDSAGQTAFTSNCLDASQLGVSGFNRDTGALNCIKKPQSACPAGQIPKSIVYQGGGLSIQCTPTQQVACPANYVLQTVSTGSLEQGKTKSGTCVFLTQPKVPIRPTPAPAPTVSGNLCPKTYYRSNVSCTITNIAQSTGTCPTCQCNCVQCNCTTTGTPPTTTCATCCDTCGGETVPPKNVGNYTLIQGTGPSASCGINNPPNTIACVCGGSASGTWSGNANLSGTCDLIPPQQVPAI